MMRMKEWQQTTMIIVGFLTVIIVGAWTQAHFEAKTYTELTGRPVTTFQAVWVQLRVDCE